MVAAELTHLGVVAIAENGPGFLAHPGDHGNGGPTETTRGQRALLGVLEQAEEPELLGGASGYRGVTLAPFTGRSPRAGFDLDVGVQGVGNRDDERQLRAHLLGREQAPDARGIAPHAPRQLGQTLVRGTRPVRGAWRLRAHDPCGPIHPRGCGPKTQPYQKHTPYISRPGRVGRGVLRVTRARAAAR